MRYLNQTQPKKIQTAHERYLLSFAPLYLNAELPDGIWTLLCCLVFCLNSFRWCSNRTLVTERAQSQQGTYPQDPAYLMENIYNMTKNSAL